MEKEMNITSYDTTIRWYMADHVVPSREEDILVIAKEFSGGIKLKIGYAHWSKKYCCFLPKGATVSDFDEAEKVRVNAFYWAYVENIKFEVADEFEMHGEPPIESLEEWY